jgi:uncharacterized membrane protein
MAAGPTNTTYNLFAGQSLERLAALSDGLFAIAMTLLALVIYVIAARIPTLYRL